MKTTKDYSNLLDVIEKHFKPDELDPIALTMTFTPGLWSVDAVRCAVQKRATFWNVSKSG
jgi:hypothetical protein